MSEFPNGTVTFLFTDVVDSTRLWDSNHAAMQTAMAAHDDIIRTSIDANGGILVKGTGDGAFAVFASAFDAVDAAVAIRNAIAGHAWDPSALIALRIGLHTGEAEFRDDDYFGSTVNRTSRVMSAAEPGEVLLSLSTQEVVRDRLRPELILVDSGEQELKGFSRPEHVFALGNASDDAESNRGGKPAAEPTLAGEDSSRRAAWIAVLPFDNLSGDTDQDYFADGITVDIITALAGWQTLRVISGTSSFHYRGTDATVDEIANDLRVSYILEGSVRKAGEKIRVTAQLIDAKTKHHVWAEKYDADLADIFDVQDKITQSIVVAIYPAIRGTETTLPPAARTESLDAWDFMLLGRAETDKFRREGNWRAIEHYRAALAIDPNYSAAHSGLAFAHFMDSWLNVTESRDQAAGLALAEARKAVALDDRDAMAHAILAYANLPIARLDAMAVSARRAIELNPSLPYGHHALGVALTYSGDHAEGLRLVDEAIKLAPHDPAMNFYLGGKAIAQLLLGEYEDAAATARRAIRIKYGYLFARLILVSALGHLGDTAGARDELDSLMGINPDFSTELLDFYPMRDVDRAFIEDGVQKADPRTG